MTPRKLWKRFRFFDPWRCDYVDPSTDPIWRYLRTGHDSPDYVGFEYWPCHLDNDVIAPVKILWDLPEDFFGTKEEAYQYIDEATLNANERWIMKDLQIPWGSE